VVETVTPVEVELTPVAAVELEQLEADTLEPEDQLEPEAEEEAEGILPGQVKKKINKNYRTCSSSLFCVTYIYHEMLCCGNFLYCTYFQSSFSLIYILLI
jgi:hypothetical protein